MKSKLIIVSLLIGLLSQQVMASVVSASMMDSDASGALSSPVSGMPHNHHNEAVSHSSTNEMPDAQIMECCQSDCAYCIAGCYSVLSSQMLKKLSGIALVPLQQSNYEPLAQAFDSLFRPPIFA